MFLFGEKGGCFLGVRLFGVVRLIIFDLWSRGYDYLGWYVYLEVYSREALRIPYLNPNQTVLS